MESPGGRAGRQDVGGERIASTTTSYGTGPPPALQLVTDGRGPGRAVAGDHGMADAVERRGLCEKRTGGPGPSARLPRLRRSDDVLGLVRALPASTWAGQRVRGGRPPRALSPLRQVARSTAEFRDEGTAGLGGGDRAGAGGDAGARGAPDGETHRGPAHDASQLAAALRGQGRNARCRLLPLLRGLGRPGPAHSGERCACRLRSGQGRLGDGATAPRQGGGGHCGASPTPWSAPSCSPPTRTCPRPLPENRF